MQPTHPIDDDLNDEGPVNIAWGENGEEAVEEPQWSSEEDDELGGQQVPSLDPFLGHIPYWKHSSWHFPELEPFSSIVRHSQDYCGPSDESNWVIPGK